ncbi:MAG: SBBP repeat-containing protein, partial [Acidobacteria bacterium]|nr:SBBP repeat-containing protein [Acidobacteriota bacterium]
MSANWPLRIGATCIFAMQCPEMLHPFVRPAVELEALLHQTPALHRDLFAGVSLRVYAHPLGLEYDWLIAPGAQPETIRMRFAGASLHLGSAGELVIQRAGRPIRHTKPRAFQMIRGREVAVAAEFVLLGSNEAGFRIGSHDPAHELVIDPVVLYSSSLGGSGGEEMAGIAMDAQGFVYVAGTVGSTDFPTTEGAFQRERKGTSDIYVSKIDRDGKRLIFSTLLGGRAEEFANGIAVDSEGNVYVAGQTYSTDYPGLDDRLQSGLWRSVITRIGQDGASVVFSYGFLGGEIHAVTMDDAGSVYFGGFPGRIPISPDAFQTEARGVGSAFVAKLLPSGQLAYASYIGGARLTDVLGLAVDRQGNAFLAGVTDSPDFPATPGAFQDRNPGYCVSCWRGFVAKVNPTGTALVYATYLGGTNLEGVEDARGIGVDDAGNAYVTGRTNTVDFPTTADALLPSLDPPNSRGPRAAFVSKLDPSGSRLLYSTFLHGGRMWDDEGVFLAVSGGKVYVAGNSATLRFPELNPVQPGRGDERAANGVVIRCGDLSIPLRYCWDLFLSVFDAAEMKLQFSTHLGSRRDDV